VGEDIDYVKVESSGEILVLAEARLPVLTHEYKILEKLKGKQLAGLSYEALYPSDEVYKIYSAGFVNTEEGTGLVHVAPVYGEDDYQLGLKEGLPVRPLLDASGHFNESAPEFIKGQYFKKAEKAIKEDLESRHLVLKREAYTHSYPHCHRCGTTLFYSALSSWFINIQKKKSQMIKLNENINWIPEHLKHGRFLNNIESAPDWTISRNRYWASPLPIWKDQEGQVYIIGSLDELRKFTKKSGNKYFIMRHGEAMSNATHVLDPQGDPNNHLTDKGKQEVVTASRALGRNNIQVIITSPFLRTRETAEVVRQELGLDENEVIVDDRLHEFNESGMDPVRKRTGEFIFEIEEKYSSKNILIISHGNPLWALEKMTSGQFDGNFIEQEMLETAEVREIVFTPYPHNENFELDLHRPYIDELELFSEEGKKLTRIPEVLDGWVESGSMPFAEYHYPFENKEEFKKRFPADFIAEYIGQTRTWFYYMHAVATLLFDKISFRNVVTTGTILASDGSKMSKSKGNYTDPMTNLDLFSADALRYYLVSSVVMQAEDVSFSDDEIRQVHNQVVNILWNSFKFYEMYAPDDSSGDYCASTHILDKWIIARLEESIQTVTEGMEAYDLPRAMRPIREFVSDFSTWYIRRSRERFKSDDLKDKRQALKTTRYVLLELSRLIAPIMPFIAEDIYKKVRSSGDPLSVHLDSWPALKRDFSPFSIFSLRSNNKNLIKDMTETRRLVSLALELRSKANIKVRQPLQKLTVKNLHLAASYMELIKEEVNVKEVVRDTKIDVEVELDTKLTPVLEEEGKLRDVIRAIQDKRKEKGLKPGESMSYEVDVEDKEFFQKHAEEIKRVTNIEF
jgi:isoleucyl-tRNA synthetase